MRVLIALLALLFFAAPAQAAEWISSPLPEMNAGPSGRGYGSKHIHCAENRDDGRLYCIGGDYGFENDGSYQQKVWSTDPRSLPIAWRLEYPYHGPAGADQPGRPDEVAFAYDTKRHLFWAWPGIYADDTRLVPQGVHVYPGFATGRWGMFTFDPTKSLIDRFKYIGGVGSGEGRGRYGIYDETTDSLWAIGEFSQLWQFHIPTRAVTTHSIPIATTGQRLDSARSNAEGVTQVGRELWVLEPYGGLPLETTTEQWVLAYNLDTKTARVVTKVPALNGSDHGLNSAGQRIPYGGNRIDLSQLIHNPDLNVVYYIRYPDWGEHPESVFVGPGDGWPTVYKYTLATGQWTVLPTVASDGSRIRGLHAIVYSRAAQRLFMMGG
jgi:hypothetical protein